MQGACRAEYRHRFQGSGSTGSGLQLVARAPQASGHVVKAPQSALPSLPAHQLRHLQSALKLARIIYLILMLRFDQLKVVTAAGRSPGQPQVPCQYQLAVLAVCCAAAAAAAAAAALARGAAAA